MNILEITDLTKSYQGHTILADVNLTINKGDIVGLIGKNGSGKTTLMKTILGFANINNGHIAFKNDHEYYQKPSLLSKFGFLLDCKLFEFLNGHDNLKVVQQYSGYVDEEEISRLLKFVDLENNNKLVKSYSFGMKQRLGLALAMLGEPEFLILDEPFVGLDPKGIQTFSEYIHKLGVEKNIPILISSHQLHEIQQLCNRFVLIKDTSLSEVNPSAKSIIELVIDHISAGLNKQLPNGIEINDSSIYIQNNSEELTPIIEKIIHSGAKIITIKTNDNNLSSYFKE